MCTPWQVRFLFLCSFLTLTAPLSAQEGREDRENLTAYIQGKYGPDQELYKGFQFYNAYFQYKGDPYFPGDGFMKGSVVYNGTAYQNISLKYDCYSQLLVLEYSDSKKRYHQILLNSASVESFTLGNWTFRRLSLAESETTFYQVIQTESLCCYIHWTRASVALSTYDRRYLYEFGSPNAAYHMLFQDQLYTFSGKKSFVNIFDKSLAPDIRRYLRENRFSFKHALPGEMEELISYVDTQLESGAAE